MSIYQKQSISSAVTVPEMENIEVIDIKDALEALGNTLKSFQALASIYKILALADQLNTEMDDLTRRRDDLRINLLDLTKQVNEANKKIEQQIQTNSEIITKFENDRNKIVNEIEVINQEKKLIRITVEEEAAQIKQEAKNEADKILKDAQLKVKQLENQANTAEAKLNKAIVDFNNLKAKFV